MSNLIEFTINNLTIPYKAPSGILNIFLNIENIDLVEITILSQTEVKVDNNVIYPNNKTINNSYNFNFTINRDTFFDLDQHTIEIILKTYNFNYNEIIEYKQTKEIIIENTYPNLDFNYYISITANINKSLTLENNSITYKGNIINKNNNNYNISYHLPSGEKQITIADIPVIDTDHTNLGSFLPKLNINANNEGYLTGNIIITGSNITKVIKDDPLKAQQIVIGNAHKTIKPNDTDILNKTITPNDVKLFFNDEINIIEQMYTKNIITDWCFKILPVNKNINNIPNALDAYAEIKNRKFPNIFLNGENIGLDTAYPYEIIINDFHGNPIHIINKTPIYALITHDDNAPII